MVLFRCANFSLADNTASAVSGGLSLVFIPVTFSSLIGACSLLGEPPLMVFILLSSGLVFFLLMPKSCSLDLSLILFLFPFAAMFELLMKLMSLFRIRSSVPLSHCRDDDRTTTMYLVEYQISALIVNITMIPST